MELNKSDIKKLANHITKLKKDLENSPTLESQKAEIHQRHKLRGLDKWNKEDCGLGLHRKKVFYKTDGLLPYKTRKGLLYETPNWELISELLRRGCSGEIDLNELGKGLIDKKYKEL